MAASTKRHDAGDLDVLEPPADARTDREATEDNAKRRQVLEGARAVFLADGFDAASMNEIARIAGVSKGTLYVYFDSKVALFEALVREERRRQAEQICVMSEREGVDVRTFLIEFATRLVNIITGAESLAHARMVLGVAAKFPQVGRAFYEAGPQVGLDRVSAYLERKVASGELAIVDVRHAAAQFCELCMAGLFKPVMFCIGGPPAPEVIAEKVAANIDVFLAAYAPQERRAVLTIASAAGGTTAPSPMPMASASRNA